MAAEFKTPAGIILSPQAVESLAFTEGKSDRSAGAQIRAITGGFGTAQMGVSRFREYQNYLGAIRIPWVYRCVMRIAESFASSNWDLMDGDTPIVTPSNPFLQLMARPNPIQSGYHFLEYQQVFMETLGEVFISLENKDAQGRPRELYVLNPTYVTVIPDPVNFVKGYLFNPSNITLPGYRPIPYEPDEIIHIKLPNPMNPYRGFGPVEASATVLDIIDAMAGHELGYYRSGGRIVGVLETEDEVGDDEFEKIKAEWKAFSSDQASRMKTAILQAGLKYTPIAEGMRAINQVEINKEKRDTILGTWGVPPTKLGILENAQYKLNDADQTFESETMMPKKDRFADALQPLIDAFDPDWHMEFERKNFEDDSVRLNNARAMNQVFAFTINEIRRYCGWEEEEGADVILIPTQMMPTNPDDFQSFADVNLDDAQNPEEPPVAPENSGTGSNNGTPGNGAAPTGGNMDQQSPKLAVVKGNGYMETKEIKDLKIAFVQAGETGEKDDSGMTEEQKVIGLDIVRKVGAARLVAHKMARRPDRYGRKAGKRTTKVSPGSPGIAAAKLQFRNRFLGQTVAQATPVVKKAFRSQRRKVLAAVEGIVTEAKKQPEEKRRKFLSGALVAALPGRPMEDAVRGIHVAGLVQGFRDGSRLLRPRNSQVLQKRLAAAKESKKLDIKAALPRTVPQESEAWRATVQAWNAGSFPFLESTFEKMGDRVTGIDETTREKLADVLEEGLRRGYNTYQLANGYEDEGYQGVVGVMDGAEDWRAEMIARTEGRDAFEAGTLASYGMGDVPEVEAMDGDEFDEHCRLRSGQVFPLDPATGQIDAPAEELDEHPNGTLTWLPHYPDNYQNVSFLPEIE